MMKTITIDADFAAWRSGARALLAEKVHPSDVLWRVSDQGCDEFMMFEEVAVEQANMPPLRVPREFVAMAKTVSCHRSGKQWAMLYEIAWSITHGKDRGVLNNSTNSTVRGLEQMRKSISRDIHKMRAFVRFRQVEGGDNGRESYVSWFEPEHFIVRLNTPFFRKRFGGMNWSILTPDECVHWDGEKVTFTEGVEKSAAPDGDALEELWRGYYRSIFNPARVKIKMMQSEMPKKYWKNLPEAEIIEELIQGSSDSVRGMMKKQGLAQKPEPKNDYLNHLKELNQEGQMD